MINFLVLFFLFTVSYYLTTYARWAWQHGYRRGAAGIVCLALLTLAVPVAVWAYHQYVQ